MAVFVISLTGLCPHMSFWLILQIWGKISWRQIIRSLCKKLGLFSMCSSVGVINFGKHLFFSLEFCCVKVNILCNIAIQCICLFQICKGSQFWIFNSICLVNAFAVSPGNKEAFIVCYCFMLLVSVWKWPISLLYIWKRHQSYKNSCFKK